VNIKGLEIRPGECHKLSGELVVCLKCGEPEYFWLTHVEQVASGPVGTGYKWLKFKEGKKDIQGFVCPGCQVKEVA